MVIGIPSQRSIGRGLNLITYLYLVPKLITIITITITLPFMFDFFAWTGTSPFFTLHSTDWFTFPGTKFPCFCSEFTPNVFCPIAGCVYTYHIRAGSYFNSWKCFSLPRTGSSSSSSIWQTTNSFFPLLLIPVHKVPAASLPTKIIACWEFITLKTFAKKEISSHVLVRLACQCVNWTQITLLSRRGVMADNPSEPFRA